jgi:hypothetical protein
MVPRMRTPVALFVFNRPDLAARVFARIAEVRPERLFLIADGPRLDRGEDIDLCAAVRRIIMEVDWPCELNTNFSDVNLGCGRRMSSGLDWVFDHVEEAIILEDDCLPSLSFFPFCAEILDRYRLDERIGIVNGTNLGYRAPPASESYLFSRYPVVWGWATWRRVWQQYDFALTSFDVARSCGIFEQLFRDAAVRRYWRISFELVRQGKIDTWDYQLQYSLLLQSRLTIIPAVNLISNLGFGRVDATHGAGNHPADKLPLGELTFPLCHPRFLVRSRSAEQLFEQMWVSGWHAPRL